jgi:sigma-54 dependent transcriptional regulator, acetoin dehydrogenase operon transcriptional activator AcoR
MRERFLAGEDVTDGVRPEVLLSWYRCRDDYAVDPFQERAPSAREREPSELLEERVVVSELAGVAKSIEAEVEALGALVAVTDGRGGILAAWGDRSTLRRAEDANLTARFAWSEQGAGTNGMGTALVSEGPIIIRGPEHWCAGFHDWDCAGVAVRDPVGRAPLGALDVSSPKAPLPNSVLSWLRKAQQTIESGLRDHAVRTLRDLAAI